MVARAAPRGVVCRVGFTAREDASVDAGVPHVETASGWTARVLVDLTGIVPYNANDFFDGGMFELGRDLTATVHDFRPAMPDTSGPDSCSHLVFGEMADVGAALWICAGTQLGGDGVYRVDASWTLTRDAVNNNLSPTTAPRRRSHRRSIRRGRGSR